MVPESLDRQKNPLSQYVAHIGIIYTTMRILQDTRIFVSPNDMQRHDPYSPTWKYSLVRKFFKFPEPQLEFFKELTKFKK